MSVGYRMVLWNRQKRLYDAALAGIVVAFMGAFIGVTAVLNPASTADTLLIRGSAVTALALLHLILCIGPLARLDRRFLLLHYNRRHLGVTMFLLAAIHAALVTFQYHGLGDQNPIVSALTAYSSDYLPRDIGQFPFEVFGAIALVILFFMAATSHDFWLRNLGAGYWKALHQGVYVAYGSLLVHVFYGALQSERSSVYPAILAIGAALVLGLHLAAARKEARADTARATAESEGFVEVCGVDEVKEGCGKVVLLRGERIAVFRHGNRLFASSNVCRHQGGPLGEGRIKNGCITCPWHGWNYRVEDGVSPPPFQEIIPTYQTRAVGDRLYIHPSPLELETRSEGTALPGPAVEAARDPFFVGYLAKAPAAFATLSRRVTVGALALGVIVLALAAYSQRPVDEGTFEFGQPNSWEGVVHVAPVPMLSVSGGPGAAPADFLLVGFGKFGIPEKMRAADGKRVAFSGTLIHRRAQKMIQIEDADGIRVLGDAQPSPRSENRQLGEVTLQGEILDLKCFLGVMRPAVGKVHRACAIRCLSGGVPPGFRAVDAQGREKLLVLAAPAGETLRIDPQFVGVAVEVAGDLEVQGEMEILRIRSVRRL